MVCVVCLKESDFFLKIFDANGIRLNIFKILEQHFCWFKFSSKDSDHQAVICSECWALVNDFHKFYISVAKAHKFPYDDTTEKICSPEERVLEIDIKEELVEHVWQADTEEQTLVNNPLYVPENVELPIPNVEEEETNLEKISFIPIAKLELDFEESENDCIAKPVKKVKESAFKPKKRKLKRKSNAAAENDNEEKTNIKESDATKAKHQKQTTTSKDDDEIVKKHIPMGCDLCTFVGDDFTQMTAHFRESHTAVKPYILCCTRKLSKRSAIVQHAYKHENPEIFKCAECLKVFRDRYGLRLHVLEYHAPKEQLQYECDQCSNRFSRRYFLQLHKASHIPINERKFICDKCPESKAFASQHFLNIHTSMRHKRATNVCHVCAKKIRDKQSFEKHVRLHFEDSGPRVKCPQPGCDRWLQDEDNLKQHLRRHNIDGKIFKCEDCGKLCKNRSSLTSHKNYAHKNEVFECEDCHKKFKRAISLREHLAQHTGESLYTCPFCPRTFNSNANMHSHKKKMHPVEWDMWRKTKRVISKQEECKTNATVNENK